MKTKNFLLLFVAILFVLAYGCISSESELGELIKPQNKASQASSRIEKLDSSLVSNPQEIQPETESKEAKKYQYPSPEYIITEYRTNKSDSISQKLKIAQNVITFFILNNRSEELLKFRDKGFPLEFWGTEMCPYFSLSMQELDAKIAIAKNLGYSDYGFLCESLTDLKWTRRVLTNQLQVQFTSLTTQEILDETLNSKDFYEVEKNPYLSNSYNVKVKNRSAKSVIKQFNKLFINANVESVEYVFSSCDQEVGLDYFHTLLL